jgi:hypothetical protein
VAKAQGAFKNEKRKKEIIRRKKQEEKRQKRLKQDTGDRPAETSGGSETQA